MSILGAKSILDAKSGPSRPVHRFGFALSLLSCLICLGGLLLAPAAQAQSASPVGIGVGGGDNLTRLVWNNPDSSISLWKIAADGSVATQNNYGPFAGWSASAVSIGPDNFARVLCTHPADGQMSLWRVDPSTPSTFSPTNYGPFSGYTALSVGVGGNNAPRILWSHTPDSLMSQANYDKLNASGYYPLEPHAGQFDVAVEHHPGYQLHAH